MRSCLTESKAFAKIKYTTSEQISLFGKKAKLSQKSTN